MTEDLLEVGYIAGAHGLTGEARVTLHDPSSQALQPGQVVYVLGERDTPRSGSGSEAQRLTVESIGGVPGHPARRRIAFEELRDRERVVALKGRRLGVRRSDLGPLDDDEFYLADAIGLPVRRRIDDGLQDLGVVAGIVDNGAQNLLEVEWTPKSGRTTTWLIPAAPGFVIEIDDDGVLVDPPAGMLPEELEPS